MNRMLRISRATFRMCWGVVSLLVSILAVPVHGQGMLLEISIDSNSYLEGEAIIARVRVTNTDGAPFQDMAYLEPSVSFLHFRMSDRNGGIANLGPVDTRIYSKPGMTLDSGESLCEITNLLDLFGRSGEQITSIAGSERWLRLQPSTYQVFAEFSARLGMVKGLKALTLRSNTVQFEVRAIEALEQVDRDLLSLAAEKTRLDERRDRVTRLMGEGDRRAAAPRFVLAAGLRGLISETAIPTDLLVQRPGVLGLRPLQAAALLKHRYWALGGSGSPAGRSWRSRISKMHGSSDAECLLHSLGVLERERAKYRGDD